MRSKQSGKSRNKLGAGLGDVRNVESSPIKDRLVSRIGDFGFWNWEVFVLIGYQQLHRN